MVRMTLRYYQDIKDYLLTHLSEFINHYKDGDIIDLPLYHGCNRVNKNGTRKEIRYEQGKQCIHPTNKRYWRKTKTKYKSCPYVPYFYWTRYNTRTNVTYLFKNKGNLVYNFKLEKYEHMYETPMSYNFYYLESIRKDLFKKAHR